MFESLLRFDAAVFWLINARHDVFFDYVFQFFTLLGNGWVLIPAMLAFVSWRAPAGRRRPALLLCAILFLVTGLACTEVKGLVRRKRPASFFAPVPVAQPADAAVAPPPRVHVVGYSYSGHSFPSGHTASAFTAAMLLVVLFGRRYWPSFLAAALVGYSRIYVGAHFPSDVLASAIVCPAVVALVHRFFFNPRAEEKTQAG
jgi:undecaprenyl-diphosphatase